MITRIYGIFEIRTNYFEPVTLMIMQNAINCESKKNKRLTFDLKGSSVGRETKLVYEQRRGSAFARVGKSKKVLKDTNFLQLSKDSGLMDLPQHVAKRLIEQLKADSAFLASHGIMDYSLLLVVEERQERTNVDGCDRSISYKEPTKGRNCHQSRDRKFFYHMGVIDYLQTWDINKKIEACAKSFLGKDKKMISAVEP